MGIFLLGEYHKMEGSEEDDQKWHDKSQYAQ